MSRYVYYEPNEKAHKRGNNDCVIRAFTKALNKPWLEVFDGLVAIARKKQYIINSKPVYVKYLKDNNFVRNSIPIQPGKSKPTVREFALEHLKGTYILSVSKHLVAVVDGYYYDRWNCGNRKVYCCYKKED